MAKRDRIKDIMDYVREMIENIKDGEEMDGWQAIIKYKDGTVKHINEIEGYKHASLNVNKIDYVVWENPEDSIDSNGKSFIRDICHGEMPNDYTQEIWNRYINYCLS